MNTETLESRFRQQIIVFIVALALLAAAGIYFSPENWAFFAQSPQPYLVTSIMLSSLYGFTFALNFSLVAGMQYLGLLHLQTDYEVVDSLLTLKYLSFPIFNLLISSILGEVRTRTNNRIKDHLKKIDELTTSTKNLSQKVNLLTSESYDLKKRLINKLETFKSTLGMTTGFQSFKREELSDFYFETVCKETGITDAVYYEYDEAKDVFFMKHYQKPDAHPLILDLNKINDPIIADSVNDGHLTAIENLIEFDELSKDNQNLALLAMPIYVSEKLNGVLAVYNIPFLEYTPNNFGLIEVLTSWFERSLLQSDKYRSLTANSIFDSHYELYTYQYFHEKLKEDFDSCKRYGVNLYLIKVKLTAHKTLTQAKQDQLKKLVSQILKTSMRTTDIATLSKYENEIYVMFSYIKPEQAEMFVTKLKTAFSVHSEGENLTEMLDINLELHQLHQFESLQTFLEQADV